MSTDWITIVGVGLALGLKHTLDADHLAAVAVLASEGRSSRSAALVGALWGLGHTAAILAAGIWVLTLGLELPDAAVPYLEGAVAAVLISLGWRGLWRWWHSPVLHMHVHRHGRRVHAHPHLHAHPHQDELYSWFHHGEPNYRPFLVGLLHGFAGSAALFLLLLAGEPTRALAWVYLASFSAASIGGMAFLSWLVCLPLRMTAGRFEKTYGTLRLGTALFSMAVGIHLGAQLLSGT